VSGDKSISNRLAMLAALASGTSTISGFLRSEDCLNMLDAVTCLGARYEFSGSHLRITGVGGRFRAPEEVLDMGNSGTGMRLLAGLLAGLPSLRVRGLYFVLSTLAVHYVVVYVFLEYQFKFFDVVGVPYPAAALGPWAINTPIRWYFFLVPLLALVYLGLRSSLRTREGRVMMAMRDHELAATSVGVDVRILRLKAFGLSSAIASMAGALYAYYLTNVTSEAFGIQFAIQFIAMIIIGGMGSLPGSLVGAALWLLLPSVIAGFAAQASGSTGIVRVLLVEHRAQLVQLIFAVLVILLLIFAPGGFASIGRQIRDRLALRRKQG
jgi:branched-chain amino acid transport system permease protein